MILIGAAELLKANHLRPKIYRWIKVNQKSKFFESIYWYLTNLGFFLFLAISKSI